MDKQLLRRYIREYKDKFDHIHKYEFYKWQAIKRFSDNWDIDAFNFHDMLSSSMAITKNLLDSGSYFPLRMLVQYAYRQPENVRQIFKDLYDEETDLFLRVANFKSKIEEIHSKYFSDRKSYQDDRAIMVYLVLKYPELYYFYKFRMFKDFSEKFGLQKPKRGKKENLAIFQALCEEIKHEIKTNPDLITMHYSRLENDCYSDVNLNILTQDFVYAVTKHLPVFEREQNTSYEPNQFDQSDIDKVENSDLPPSNFNGKKINFIAIDIEKKRIGTLGEKWVMEFENQNLRKWGIKKNAVHTSEIEGDGTGFDIASFDCKGNPIFIEVKTTTKRRETPFFLTRTEMERSQKDSKNYFLYRLYNFDEETNETDLFIIKGDLSSVCTQPDRYIINLQINDKVQDKL